MAFKYHYGRCVQCNQAKLIVVKAGLCAVCNSGNKKEEKANRPRLEKFDGTIKASKVEYFFGKVDNLTKLKADLDVWFSYFIRLRDADENGIVKCFTSGKRFHWKKIQAGHFVSRRHLATRWDEKNVQPQSVSENMFNQGNAPVFAQRLDEKYGNGTADGLIMKSRNKCEMDAFKYKFLIKDYMQKVKQLKQQKGIE